jgi:rubrerythrin
MKKYEADHALQVAIQMEHLGKTFYQTLASCSESKQIRQVAASLASAEEKHLELFEQMRQKLPATERGPRMTEEEQYRSAAELRGQILPTVADIRKIAMGTNAVATMDIAIKMERDAVLYYTKMAATVTGSDLTILNKIIDMEHSHVELLQKHRMGLL